MVIELIAASTYLLCILAIALYLKKTAWKGNFEFNEIGKKTFMNSANVNNVISANSQAAPGSATQQSPASSAFFPTSAKDVLFAQLHEQYAVNNNAGMQSVVSLLVGMFAILGAYGYVLLHTTENCRECLDSCFTSDNLLFTFACSMLVLLIMTHICVYQGCAQRLEQFIVYGIRKEYNLITEESSKETKIFPSDYKPCKKNPWNFIQGLYGEFVKIFTLVAIVLCAATLCILKKTNAWDGTQGFYFCVIGTYLCGMFSSISWLWNKYKKREQDYSKNNKEKSRSKILSILSTAIFVVLFIISIVVSYFNIVTEPFDTKTSFKESAKQTQLNVQVDSTEVVPTGNAEQNFSKH
ncbi:MAG: hypothetical protein MJZ25_03400 [Fibrobacter sp.]|nr:hypothetical protein [Fibrobacter sp.]